SSSSWVRGGVSLHDVLAGRSLNGDELEALSIPISSTAVFQSTAPQPTAPELVRADKPPFLETKFQLPRPSGREKTKEERELGELLVENLKRNLREGHETS